MPEPGRKVSPRLALRESATFTFNAFSKECKAPAANCGPETTVSGSLLEELQNAAVGGAGGIADYFSGSQGITTAAQLNLTANQLANLQSGTYGMLEVRSPSVSNRYYFLVGPESTLNLENSEYQIMISVN